MTEHLASIQWNRNQATFTDNRYSREHTWRFAGGAEVSASSSPHVVPVPYSNSACIDPEEAFVAALSSCHMLWFLSIAAKKMFVVERYIDRAIGVMERNQDGNVAITKVCLRPEIAFVGDNLPTDEQVEKMHREAHHRCFLANSVKTEIVIEATRLLKEHNF